MAGTIIDRFPRRPYTYHQIEVERGETGGVRAALGHAEALESVDQVADGVRGQPEIDRQRTLPGRPLLVEVPEHLGPGHGQAASAHLVVDGPEHPVMDGQVPFTGSYAAMGLEAYAASGQDVLTDDGKSHIALWPIP